MPQLTNLHHELHIAKFPMGKHRGESLARVIDEDFYYCVWIIQQAWFQNKYPDLLEILLEGIDSQI